MVGSAPDNQALALDEAHLVEDYVWEPGSPLAVSLQVPIMVVEGRLEVFLHHESGRAFLCELSREDVLWAPISVAKLSVVVVASARLKKLRADQINAGVGLQRWRELLLESQLPAVQEDLNTKFAELTPKQAEAFNDAVASARLAVALEHEASAIERLNLPRSASVESLPAMLQVAADWLNVPLKKPKNPPQADEFSRLPQVVHAFGLRAREVRLEEGWLHHEQGPLLLQRRDGGELACAIWNGKQYQLSDGTALNEGLREAFHSHAVSLFAPLEQEINGFMSLARYLLRGNRAEFGHVALAAAFIALLGALTPLATGWILTDIAPAGELGMLVGVGAALLVAAVVNFLLSTTRSVSIARIQGRTDMSLNAALYDRLLQLPTGFFRDFTAGDLNQRLANANAIKSLILGTALSAGLSVVLSLFYFALLVYYDGKLALVAVLLVSVFMLIIMLARVLQKPYLQEAYALDGELAEQSYEMIAAVAKLRSAAAEERALARWSELYRKERGLQQSIERIGGVFGAFSTAWQMITMMVLFAVAAWAVNSDLPPGLFIAFLVAFGAFQGAFVSLSQQAIEIYAAQPQLDRALPMFTTPVENIGGLAEAETLRGDIEMRSVTFAYQAGQAPVINNLSVKIKQGQHCAIVGGSGSGKSTLLRLLLGFETPQGGAIYYDQQDLAQLDTTSVRRQIGVVLQSSSLYAGSIIDNIRGSSDASLEACLMAASKAGLDADLLQFPMGIHTPLTEGAATLSGGQRQRILIARAFVSQPSIMFFDEATSALDNTTQAQVAHTLDRLDITRITIAHRLSTVRNADQICVLKDGRFVEQGNYDELMARKDEFYSLAQRQLVESQQENDKQ